jgi:hypothetical protein
MAWGPSEVAQAVSGDWEDQKFSECDQKVVSVDWMKMEPSPH